MKKTSNKNNIFSEYPIYEVNPNFANVEKNIISIWEKNSIFEKSILNPGGKTPKEEYVFYDGPPFANGLPHYGHLLCGYIKDIAGRYHSMLGKRVMRRFGWDCHGLPAEMGVMKEIGISTKFDIEKYGIEKFNQDCRNSVMNFSRDWEEYITRQARWVDYKNPYRTLDIGYMQSVIWAFKQMYNKGLIYQSERIMPYSWACETPVSDFETKMDNSYREKKSKSVVVLFKITELSEKLTDIVKSYSKNKENNNKIQFYALAWTTTPWTLPSNLGLAVGSSIEYSLVFSKNSDICYIIASALIDKYADEIGYDSDSSIVLKCKGEDIAHTRYHPLFKYFIKHNNAFQIMIADFVTIEDGTGIVHIAPGFGEDDYNLCCQYNIEIVCPVDSRGRFTSPVSDFIGEQVFETNDRIIAYLKEQGLWLKTEQYIHNYPHCWRTDTPLIYKAISSWYLKVTAIKDQMIDNNQKINWVPTHIKNGIFGKWIENARDWSISRNRYWGCPIPVWISDDQNYPHTEVYGSIEELEKSFGVKISSLHRPEIDNLVKPNPSDPTGKSQLRRVPEVLDCWFESGSMPFAHVNYPFENKDWFEKNFPADLIVEYIGQTRGWFYTLMVISTALFNKPPFYNCICHGVVLGEGGTKLSKRLKNYADPMIVFEEISSDALRWAMVSSQALRGEEIIINKDADNVKEALRMVIKPFWSAYNFFSTYANIDKINPTFSLNSDEILDHYIITKTIISVNNVKRSMNNYDIISACLEIETILEIINNWYIRRSREKFWQNELSSIKLQAYNTLYTILDLICRISAPLLPLISEAIYLGLHHDNNQENNSVHLISYPNYDDYDIDWDIITNMERIRSACSTALSLRNEYKIKVRQPLSSVIFIGISDNKFNEKLQQLVLDEINVKKWVNLNADQIDKYADRKLILNLHIIGKKIPHKTKEIISALKNQKWKYEDNNLYIADIILEKDMYDFQLIPKNNSDIVCKALPSQDGLVMIETLLNQDLIEEGIARDIIRHIQQLRKNSRFNVMDRIKVKIWVDDDKDNQIIIKAINNWDKYISSQVLSEDIILTTNKLENYKFYTIFDIDKCKIMLSIDNNK
ncbi:isoleucine--tRNA ligase [Lyticum sinuosum]|uniref:Isoleucine--tRNA ligase n=1 Tax=Lyticum sinuosum TaxID=1332059 RepID=A0AAE4VLE9_9RICK|nr:isoleucine--tRNA ligase [Lyticum sinuosum]MDZ5760916.1 Isoleucine--tRNA ligase [Lyticum sinuosum]